MLELASPAAASALSEGVARLADVHHQALDGVAVRLELTAGHRPVVWIDDDATDADLCRALLEVLNVLAFGADTATSARHVRRLRSVS